MIDNPTIDKCPGGLDLSVRWEDMGRYWDKTTSGVTKTCDYFEGKSMQSCFSNFRVNKNYQWSLLKIQFQIFPHSQKSKYLDKSLEIFVFTSSHGDFDTGGQGILLKTLQRTNSLDLIREMLRSLRRRKGHWRNPRNCQERQKGNYHMTKGRSPKQGDRLQEARNMKLDMASSCLSFSWILSVSFCFRYVSHKHMFGFTLKFILVKFVFQLEHFIYLYSLKSFLVKSAVGTQSQSC